MKWFINLSTRGKLLLSFGVLILLLETAVAVAFPGMSALLTSQRALQEVEMANALDLLRLEANLNENRVSLMRLVLTRERFSEEIYNEIKALSATNDEITQRLLERNAGNAELSGQLKELDQARRDFNTIRDEHVIPMIAAGNFAEAEVLILGEQTQRFLKVREMVTQLSHAAREGARTTIEQAMQRVNVTISLLVAIGALVFLVSVALATFLTAVIANPLARISRVAAQVATGDLDVSVPASERKDEVGMLAQAFERMVLSLQELARAAEQIADGDLTIALQPQSPKDVLGASFSVMAENVRGLVQEIQQGANLLQSQSAETLKMTLQLVSDSAEMETAARAAEAVIQEARQSPQLSDREAGWIARLEAAMAGIQRAGTRSAASSLEAQVTAEKIEELGTRLSFVVGRLRV